MAGRPRPPDDVYFPVVPMLDMAFQLLAFFILTFQPPGREARIDLDLPSSPAVLPPRSSAGDDPTNPAPGREPDGLVLDAIIQVEADAAGRIRVLRLDGIILPDVESLIEGLRGAVIARGGEALAVGLIAEDRLHYEEAARLLGACAAAEITSVRLMAASPGSSSALPETAP